MPSPLITIMTLRGLKSGIDGFLLKPINERDLSKIFSQIP
jgi:YesN/AraC family two-component response regulator